MCEQELQLKVRLDKWLWAARFFKTRAQAKKAIVGGKILVDGLRIKPAREILPGVVVNIRKDRQSWEVLVDNLSSQRGSATLAQQLYTETPESIEQRELARLQQKSWHQTLSTRPTKRERRQALSYRENLHKNSLAPDNGQDNEIQE